jgi:peptidoglycan hydrolase-like protein with peptidoglycan-binding domain
LGPPMVYRGGKTREAVKVAQACLGLVQDGRVGLRIFQALSADDNPVTGDAAAPTVNRD